MTDHGPSARQVMLSLGRGRAPDGIVCIGHSLGGAVAQLAALWLAQRFPRADLRVVTFGSPRVGNRAFKVSYPIWNPDALPAGQPAGCHLQQSAHQEFCIQSRKP